MCRPSRKTSKQIIGVELTFMLYRKMLNHLIHWRNSGTVESLTSNPLKTIMQTQTRAVRMVPMVCWRVDALNTRATEQPARLVSTMFNT